MPLLGLVVTLIIIGLALYLISLLPIDGKIKQIIYAIVIVVVIIWLLYAFVPAGSFYVPRHR